MQQLEQKTRRVLKGGIVALLVAFSRIASGTIAVAAVLPISPGSWTLAILPDTQGYSLSASYAPRFFSQTQFLRDHAADLNLKYVLHEGDVTENNVVDQWDISLAAMNVLNGTVPYAMVTGNHDVGPNGNAATRNSLFNAPAYFGPGSYYATQPSVGGFFRPTETASSWHTFDDGDRDWLIMNLEWAPSNEVVAWANQVLDAHPDHRAIVLTHAYMFSDNTRYNWAAYGYGQYANPHAVPPVWLGPPDNIVNDGEELWNKLVRTHDNIDFVFSGHVLSPGTGYRSDLSDGGHAVHQMLANSQDDPNGIGNMRLLEFKADGKVEVRTYSPWYDRYSTVFTQQFTLELGTLHGPLGPPAPPLLPQAVAANLVVGGATNPTTNTVGTITVAQSSSPAFRVPLANRGDYELAVGAVGLQYYHGILLSSITQHERPDFLGRRATVEASRNSFSDGFLALSLTEAGSAWPGKEVNFNTSVAWFQFQAGFRGAHVNSDGSLAPAAFNGVVAANVTHPAAGRYRVELGVDAIDDGMLFVTGNNNHNVVVQTGILADASGWDVRVAYNGSDFGSSVGNEHWSFLYLPFNSPGLIGGYYDGETNSTLKSVGDFTMNRLGNGQYELAVPGQTPQTGMLIMSIAKERTIGGITSPDDNILTYEPSANGTFLINAYDAPGFGFEDTTFAWAFVGFADGIGGTDIGGDSAGLSNFAIWRSQYGTSGASLSTDWNRDGTVDAADYVMWRNRATSGVVGSGSGLLAESPLFIPEPNNIGLILTALLSMTARVRLRSLRSCWA